MSEHVAIEGIEGGVVDVGNEYAFAQIQHQNARNPAESTKCLLVGARSRRAC
jgi:hypothetical protein